MREKHNFKHYNQIEIINGTHLKVVYHTELDKFISGSELRTMLADAGTSPSRIPNLYMMPDNPLDLRRGIVRGVFLTAFEDLNMTSAEITIVDADFLYADSKGNPIGDKKYCDYSEAIDKFRYCYKFNDKWYDKDYGEKCDIIKADYSLFIIPSSQYLNCDESVPFNLY